MRWVPSATRPRATARFVAESGHSQALGPETCPARMWRRPGSCHLGLHNWAQAHRGSIANGGFEVLYCPGRV